MRKTFTIAAWIVLAAPVISYAAPTPFTASGANPSDIQTTVDSFRAALGALNANQPVSFVGGRREINWDAVPDTFSDPSSFPGNFFNQNFAPRARGAEFTTPGTGFLVSSNAASGVPVSFGFSSDLRTFSPERLFAPVGSTITDVRFFLPSSTTTPAGVSGFGVVFTDVETSGATTVEFFDESDNSITVLIAPVSGNAGFSFAGLTLDPNDLITRVRINTGESSLLSNGSISSQLDLVVMDDFIYGEPRVIPEPMSVAILALGVPLLMMRRRR